MRAYTVNLPATVTDAATPNDAAFPIDLRRFALPDALPGSDEAPRTLVGALVGAAAATVELWAKSEPSGPWVRTGTLTIASEYVAVPVAPGTAGAPTAFQGAMAIRITAAAATAAVLHLFPAA